MQPPNGTDFLSRNTILIIVMLAVLAQLCSIQLAHGEEKFLTGDSSGLAIEIRPEATVVGDDIRLRQIARWSDHDKTTLDPIGELVVAHFGEEKAFKSVTLQDIKSLLGDAGVNVATLNFVGPMTCRVNRSDASFAPGQRIEQYTAVQNAAPTAAVATVPNSPYHTLRDLLITNLADKLNLPQEDLQMTFRSQDETVLRLCEPHYKFDITPQRNSNLGDVSWSVSVASDSGAKRYYIPAEAKAWKKELIVVRGLATRQTITDQDVAEKRLLVDNLPNDTLLTRDQIVNQAAARDLKAGTVLTAQLVDPVQMVKGGQYVSVESTLGGVSIRSVARALESGNFGQSIRVRNETTKETFNTVITGPQQTSLTASPAAISE